MKKIFLVIVPLAYIPIAYLLFFHSCAPRITFDITPVEGRAMQRLFIYEIRDARPLNEKTGYDIVYIRSISDGDYPKGFGSEFGAGLRRSLGNAFTVVDNSDAADVTMQVTVKHFYGEYFRSFEAALCEFGSAPALFLPRLVTDAIPYNAFAGRAAVDVSVVRKNGKTIIRSLDVKVTDRVATYQRGRYDTAARLCRAASPEWNALIAELYR
jgi:hypothetical protein